MRASSRPGAPWYVALGLAAVSLAASLVIGACGGSSEPAPVVQATVEREATPTEAAMESTPAPTEAMIAVHVDVDAVITVGMTAQEVEAKIADPAPPWFTLDLSPWAEGNTVRIDVVLPDGSPLALTPEGAGDDAPYYAYIFFPKEGQPNLMGAALRSPRYAFFDASDDTVISVSTIFCQDTVRYLRAVSGEGLMPSNSMCQPN